ncbi:Crp/Fnr family transcriptional regulator [Humibacillus xanthopallidus]|uniref:Crp/Fnr family transcriptional regulator n=1 Tax=Humibacillus xanthopallidus TaxID=412689 RepID=UPI00384C9751
MTLHLGLLAELDAEDQRRLVARMRRRSFEAGDIVFHEGDPADSVHFLTEGRVVAKRSSVSGDRVAYTVSGPGEAFGELGMLSADRRRTATVQAVARTVTLSLSYAEFDALRSRHPPVERLLVLLLAARVQRLTEGLMEALHVSAEARVARRLLDLTESHATGARPGVPLLVTQTELAELAGVTRPTANRVLRRLAEAGAVDLSRARIVVRDPAWVRQVADLPPTLR